MSEISYHLAQANIGRMLWPLDDARMAGLWERLEHSATAGGRQPGICVAAADGGGERDGSAAV